MDKVLDLLKTMDLAKVDGDSLVIDSEAEEQITMLLEAEDIVKRGKEVLKERFLRIAQKNRALKKYEGAKIMVGYRISRRKRVTGDPDKEFVKVELKPNTQTVNAYREATGELPPGIEEETFEYITFKKI